MAKDGAWRKVHDWFAGWLGGTDPDGGKELLEEARNSLAATWAVVQAQMEAVPPQPPRLPQSAIEEIDTVLGQSDGLSWANLDRAEQLVVACMDGDLLDEAIARRLAEFEGRKLPGAEAAAKRFADMIAANANVDRKRAFLRGIVTDLQHYALRATQVRRLRRSAIKFVSGWSFFALLIALVPLLAFFLHSYFPDWGVSKAIADVIGTFPNYGLYTAVSFGLLGALFSRFIAFQRGYLTVPLDDAEAYYSRGNIRLHMLIGTVGAMIMYFIAASGLIQGGLVPDVKKLTFEAAAAVTDPAALGGATAPVAAPPATGQDSTKELGVVTVINEWTDRALVPSRNLALLIVWALVAGFSERLVPNLLESTASSIEARAGKPEKPAGT